jgi:hypothetical protein
MASDDKEQIAVRLPGGLLMRLDAYKDRVKADLPGVEFTRADAVRVLLERALTAEGLAKPARPTESRSDSKKRRSA